jgi:hypothetical protein
MSAEIETTTIPKVYPAYHVATIVARNALTGVKAGQLCLVDADLVIYRWTGTAWETYINPATIKAETLVSVNERYVESTPKTTVSLVYVKVKEVVYTAANGLTVTGIRIIHTMRSANAVATVNSKIYKNGVAVGIEQSATGGSTKTEDFAALNLVVGDKIQIYGKTTDVAQYMQADNIKLSYDAQITQFNTRAITTPLPASAATPAITWTENDP